MSEDTEFFNQCLWQYNDRQISNSFLNVDKFTTTDKWGVSPLRLKFSISQFKAGNGNSIYLTHQDVFTILQRIKSKEKELPSIVSQVNADTNHQVNITVKLKKKIIITFLNKIEYGGCCIRLIISDKTDNYLDSEKVYMPIFDFLSLIKLLSQFRDSYISISDSMYNNIIMDKLSTEVKDVNEKLSGYYSEAIHIIKGKKLLESHQTQLSSRDPITAPMIDPSEITPKMDESFDVFDGAGLTDEKAGVTGGIVTEEKTADEIEEAKLVEIGMVSPPEQESKQEQEPVSEEFNLQSDMDSFLKEEAPKVDLKLNNDENKNPEADTSAAIVSDVKFTEAVLDNDVLNLEMYITNLVNDDLPFKKLCDIIESKLGFNPIEDISQSDINSTNYLISNYLKCSLKKCLENQEDFPANVSPILFSNSKLSDKSISLMYDLFIYFIYYTQLRNMLKEKDFNPINNRDFICFSFKTIASPLAISGFNQIDETVMLNEITNRYRRYRENGVFDKLRAEVKSKYSCEFDLPEDALKNEATRIYTAIKANYDKLTVEYAFQKYSALNLKIDYNDFKENKFDDEQIKKIIAVEFNFRKNGKVIYDEISYAKFDDIPSSVLEKFDIKEKKYDNTNLKRYIKEITKDDEQLQKTSLDVVNKINYSYRDLRNVNVDFANTPQDILQAIYMWDIDRDEKITINYLHYREVVQGCSLTKDMLVSLLTNIQDVIDVNFVNSFIAARDE